jgi:hypothetical protein
MPTLREHAAARSAQSTLSRLDADTYRQALRRTFEQVRSRFWPTTPPTDAEYVAVVIDQLVDHGRLTEDEYRAFSLLSRDVKRLLALSVGPGDEPDDEDDDDES